MRHSSRSAIRFRRSSTLTSCMTLPVPQGLLNNYIYRWFNMGTVFLKKKYFYSVDAFEGFMCAPTTSRSIGGIVEVHIGAYEGLPEECYAHVFAFVVVQSAFGTNSIIACDRGQPCQTYVGSHIEAELLDEIECRQVTWPEFVSLHAKAHPGVSMRQKARAWKKSRLFAAWVTLLIDDRDVPTFKMTKLESLHHKISSVCAERPALRHTIGRLFRPISFDQQQYPICWIVSVVWLLALLPRLIGERNADLRDLVTRVMSARTMDRWVKEIHASAPTRRLHKTWRMPPGVVNEYNVGAAPHGFDLTEYSSGGFPSLLLEAALRSVGITLRES